MERDGLPAAHPGPLASVTASTTTVPHWLAWHRLDIERLEGVLPGGTP